ncbi:MAG: hypothetical protein J4F46_10600 [Dehalococcoidia bacterium]|nr:hypothetical protein [Dehalococcoidia bacterium]
MMSTEALGGSGLQSGFVLAVVIAAVLLANHLGGSVGLAKRVTQVALGLVLMMLVFSATTAFHGPLAIPVTELETVFDSEQQLMELNNESAQRNSDVGTIHVGLGIIFVALGVVLFRKLSAVTPAFLLGGVLLILLGAPTGREVPDPLNAFAGLLGAVLPGTLSDAGNARDIARFVVLLVGTVLLAGLIYFRWERDESPGDAPEKSES